jgi:hypothetical protein
MSSRIGPCNHSASSCIKRRVAYSLAAGAAAGAAAEAHAAIVYSGPQNINVAQSASQNIDLNLDGVHDIKLENYVFGGGNYQGALVSYVPGKLVGFNSGLSYVSALSAGATIDGSTVGPGFGSMAYGTHNPNAQFNNVTGAFIGLGFPAGANTLYGWVRVDVNNSAGTLKIEDWAYESQPGIGIKAGAGVPEPGTLGLLAAGGAGLLALRRKRAHAG